MKRKYAWVIFAVISIFLVCCARQKSHDVKSTIAQPDTSAYQPSGYTYDNVMKTSNAEDEYNDRLDDYLDDPEDELRFDPETFDFQDD